MRPYSCLLAWIACACFSAALPPPDGDTSGVIKALFDAKATVGNATLIDGSTGEQDTVSARHPALSRRTDNPSYRTFMESGAKVLVLASRRPGRQTGWKLHVSICMEVPSENFANLLENNPGGVYGISMTAGVAEVLETRFPGLADPGSSRGVFQSYDSPRGVVSMLLGREWLIGPFDNRRLLDYFSVIQAHYHSYSREALMKMAVVREAHVGGDAGTLRRSWENFYTID